MGEYADYGWTNEGFTLAHEHYMLHVIDMLPKPNSKEAILDIGCGNGVLANYLIERGYNVYGTDASVTGIEIAKKKNFDRFFLQDLSKDNLPEELCGIKFKTIISTEVIEHLYDPYVYIAFCKKIVRKFRRW